MPARRSLHRRDSAQRHGQGGPLPVEIDPPPYPPPSRGEGRGMGVAPVDVQVSPCCSLHRRDSAQRHGQGGPLAVEIDPPLPSPARGGGSGWERRLTPQSAVSSVAVRRLPSRRPVARRTRPRYLASTAP